MSADRAKMFMEQTHAHATIMCGMLDRLKESGLMDQVVDTAAQPA
jgi:predicted transcriptional regulator